MKAFTEKEVAGAQAMSGGNSKKVGAVFVVYFTTEQYTKNLTIAVNGLDGRKAVKAAKLAAKAQGQQQFTLDSVQKIAVLDQIIS